MTAARATPPGQRPSSARATLPRPPAPPLTPAPSITISLLLLSGVAVLSPTESGGCSGSDLTEPGSPCSPASSCGAPEDVAAARMPPWSSEPAPAGPRRAAPAPATPRRPPSNSSLHRRITEYFSHKMKPHNGLKRDSTATAHNEPKKKCSKNGVSHDLEKYLSYLSQTLSPRVQLDINKQAAEEAAPRPVGPHLPNGVADAAKLGSTGAGKHHPAYKHANGLLEFGCPKPCTEKSTAPVTFNRLSGSDAIKDKNVKPRMNGLIDSNNKHASVDPSATKVTDNSKQVSNSSNRKISQNNSLGDCTGTKMGLIDDTSTSLTSKVTFGTKSDFNRLNGVKNTTAHLDYKMNGVTCGSNNLSLNHVTAKPVSTKRETQKKPCGTPRRTNRKSSACIANSKNLTWSKANNLKQVQLQKQNCINSVQTSPVKSVSSEANQAPKIPNGMRQLPIAMNGNINGLNAPVTNFQNCHQINIQQPCNGTVTSANLASFVAVPQNVMLTTLRIPQNGIATPAVNQHTNINAYSRPNVNVASPTKINGQFVFPLVQNLNGAVVQIPNLMAKMTPNFVIPQSSQIQTQRQDLQNQQAAQILINGTILKLTNAVASNYPNVTKPVVSSNLPMPPMSKNVVPNVSAVGVSLPTKSNFATINVSHPVLLPQPGFIINSVPNISVKETWSNTSSSASTSTHSTISCTNPTVHHPSITNNILSSQTFHSSSIPIQPVKPPDKSNQIVDPSVGIIKEIENTSDNMNLKCNNIPWLSKTVNNNEVAFDSSKTPMRPFAEVCNLTEKLPDFATLQKQVAYKKSEHLETTKLNITLEKTTEELRRVEAVARREETIFTQITVLKDVSSNIHNTVIETTNFTSVTNESSESGIGTDKSIDSPSDSQTSKEGDEDSGLSLSISICSLGVQNSQKSPILKQPKTLRFPPKSASKAENSQRTPSGDTTSTVTVCLWEECKREFENDTDLLEHLQVVHVESQVGRENYVCLWSGCKVRGKPSCSRLWLERHTLSHGGNKPFKCIVDGCGRRFSTQILLERHVNNHFNEQSPNTGTAKKTIDSAPKLIRRNGKKLRYRRQPWSARMFDFFDAGTMEGLAWRLARSTRWRLGGCCPLKEPTGRHTLTLTAALTATRYNTATARTEALVTYHPPHVLEDEWVPEKEVKRIKRVEIAQLPAHIKVMLYEQFCASYRALPPPPSPPPAPAPAPAPAARRPLRACAASGTRLLTNLMSKQRRSIERRDECTSSTSLLTSLPPPTPPLPLGPQPSGAAKRKLGLCTSYRSYKKRDVVRRQSESRCRRVAGAHPPPARLGKSLFAKDYGTVRAGVRPPHATSDAHCQPVHSRIGAPALGRGRALRVIRDQECRHRASEQSNVRVGPTPPDAAPTRRRPPAPADRAANCAPPFPNDSSDGWRLPLPGRHLGRGVSRRLVLHFRCHSRDAGSPGAPTDGRVE
ncbi:Zinc finger protein jing homolog [Eumeta japonica]|uniref:Zinc finger protein jing homolog n=1 Tax=Eumeta variegata TaxID=151549 RepID=A0A4C1SZ54_EUMVA|nr:Zinc finger protein jing homolog [Eumeta japonica]